MPLHIEDRLSDSPYIERVWRAHSEQIDTFISVAFSQWELVAWTHEGKTQISLRGPEVQASQAPVPEDAAFFGIIFKTGTFIPQIPVGNLVNSFRMLPEASRQSFWLNSSTWELPNYENADTFADWLVRDGLLVRDPIVGEVIQNKVPEDISLRTVQRRFLRATGISHKTMYQIERARYAAILLQQGTPILDVVFELGYFDHSHLTHAMTHYIGQTPTQLMEGASQLSFLYKVGDLG